MPVLPSGLYVTPPAPETPQPPPASNVADLPAGVFLKVASRCQKNLLNLQEAIEKTKGTILSVTKIENVWAVIYRGRPDLDYEELC